MKDLLIEEQIVLTELQNFAVFKSYRILKFGKLVGSLIKRTQKLNFQMFYVFLNYFCICNPIQLKFGTQVLHIKAKNLEYFFEKYCQLLILCQFYTKKMPQKHKKLSFSKIFSCKIDIISKFTMFLKKDAPDCLPLSVEAIFQISARLHTKCKSSSKKLKIPENSISASFFMRNPTKFPNFKLQ